MQDTVDQFLNALKRAEKEGLAYEFVSAFFDNIPEPIGTMADAIKDALYEWDL